MKEKALELLNFIHKNNYEAYIVGGFVRDYLLGIESKDIDICTNATPQELKEIFKEVDIDKDHYGSIVVYHDNFRFEITTYRKEGEYTDFRHPREVTYINDLYEDLLRRDFTINAICMDKNGKIIDPLNGKEDLNNKIIKAVYNADVSFKTDALRILRAIRFSILLDFKIDDEVLEAIKNNKNLLSKLSFNRRKSELDKIFGSKKAYLGIQLLKDLDIYKELGLLNINRVKDYTDIVGIWAMINNPEYPFTNSEKKLIQDINTVYDLDNLDVDNIYKYGLYANLTAGINKGLTRQQVLEKYNTMQIHDRLEINITPEQICDILSINPSKIINTVLTDLEYKLIHRQLKNEYEELKQYILSKEWE